MTDVRSPALPISAREPSWALFSHLAAFILAVVLPAFAAGVEVATRVFKTLLFDPLPTLAHVALVLAVPLVALRALLALRCPRKWPATRRVATVTGIAASISAFYGLVFLPLAPIAAFAIVWVPINPLPAIGLIPVLCAPSIAWLALALRSVARDPRAVVRDVVLGVLTGGALLVGAELAAYTVAREPVARAAFDQARVALPATWTTFQEVWADPSSWPGRR